MCKGKIKSILQSMWPDVDHFDEGGNSWVYKAIDNGRPIAIKVFRRFGNPERYPRFVQEIKTMASIKDTDGIVPVIVFNENTPETIVKCDEITAINDLAYFAMPLYEGNLASQLTVFSDDDGTKAVKVMLQISKTLKSLHEKNLAHRDLKPENILFDGDGKYFISDFGLSIDLDNMPEPDQRMSGTLELIGSVSYRAPELLRGRLDKGDHRPCDVFSIGRILWSLIYGKEPHMITDLEFDNLTFSKCGHSIKKSNILDDILKGTTTLNPQFRITINELIIDLENWLMDDESGTNAAIIDSLIGDSSVEGIIAKKKIYEEVFSIHNETKVFLNTETLSIISDWRLIMQKYFQATGQGNQVLMFQGRGMVYPKGQLSIRTEQIEPEASPWVRINFGTNKYHLIDLAVYFTVDCNRYDGQLYAVMACYQPAGIVPPESAPQLLFFEEHYFDYRQANIREEILNNISRAFKICDELFRSQF